MSLSQIEDLQHDWRNAKVLTALESAFDRIGFTEAYVNATCSQATSGGTGKSKVIKDNVWGMIEVEPSSLRLLDSPLLQRLRGIRQLGLSYLTYPSAEHTRFVHSLGMYAVISRLLEVIKRDGDIKASPSSPFELWRPIADDCRFLRHAALLHDVGHLPFSHATESIIDSDWTIYRCGELSASEFMGIAADRLEKTISFSECMSLAIVLTDRFSRFYRGYVQRGANDSDTKRIAALIAGIAYDDGLEGVATIVSGKSVDADKIDYINRDGHACGIPVGIDVSRLFLRSSLLKVKREEIRRITQIDPGHDQVVFVVNASGLDSVEEIGQGRTMLYQRVYRHQTTRNAERLLGMALYSAAIHSLTGSKNGQPSVPDFADTTEIWRMDDLELEASLSNHTDPPIAALGTRLLIRRLPKRACIFSRYHIRMAFAGQNVLKSMTPHTWSRIVKQVLGTRLDRLRVREFRGSVQRELEEAIREEATRLAVLVRGKGDSDWPPAGSPEVVSSLAMPNLEERSDCFILENSELTSTAASSTTDEQMDAADIAKARGYVFADEPWREIVFIATRTVLYESGHPLSNIHLEAIPGITPVEIAAMGRIFLDLRSVAIRVGLNMDRLQILVHRAVQANYFDKFPRLAPVDIDDKTVVAIESNLRDFCGQGNWVVTQESIKAFLAQHPPHLRKSVSKLLCEIRMYRKEFLVPRISSEISKIDLDSRSGFIVGLSPDSGNAVRVSIEHELRENLQAKGWTVCKTIRDAMDAATSGDHLVLCDDNVVSGFQATCQFKAWLGKPMTDEEKLEQGIEHTS